MGQIIEIGNDTPSTEPLSRIVLEGTIGDCPKCKSTTFRKYNLGILGQWGKILGCINPDCVNYHMGKRNLRNNKLDKLGIYG